MSEAVWTPRMTVSAVIHRDGRFLVVEEHDSAGERVLNQPAGHVEEHESLISAVQREVMEETGYAFEATAFTGLYRWQAKHAGLTFMRLNFIGEVAQFPSTEQLDKDIIAAHWLSLDEISARKQRSPLVLRCIEDYLNRPHYPLSALIDAE